MKYLVGLGFAAFTAGAFGAAVYTFAMPAPATLPNGCGDVSDPLCVPRGMRDRGSGRDVDVAGKCRRNCRDEFPETAPRGDLG